MISKVYMTKAIVLLRYSNYASSTILFDHRVLAVCTGKSLSEVLILASTNPQYHKRLFIDLHISSVYENYKLSTCCVHTQIVLNVKTKSNLCTQYVLNL